MTAFKNPVRIKQYFKRYTQAFVTRSNCLHGVIMHYRNILLSTLIPLLVGYAPSITAMKQQNLQLQAKQAAMRQKLSQRTQRNATNHTERATTHAQTIINTKHQSLILQTQPFLDACIKGSNDDVSTFIKHNPTIVKSIDGNYVTGLHAAASNGHLSTVQLLLANGADIIHDEDSSMQTPLHHACLNGHLEVARYLISNDANVHARDEKGQTPMHCASRHGHLDITILLARNGADCNQKSSLKYTPLCLACQYGHLDIVEFLTEDRTTINTHSSYRATPLHFACQKTDSSAKIVSLLIKRGALINAQTINNVTPLHTACSCDNIDAVKILVENGAYINLENDEDSTPFDVAVQAGYTEIVEYLTTIISNQKNMVKKLTAPSIVNPVVLNQAIIEACIAGSTDDIALFIKLNRQAVINAKDLNNYTALHYACVMKKLAIVKMLLEAGARIDAENDKLRTPLHTAYESDDNIDVIDYLLTYEKENNCLPNSVPLHDAKSIIGATPLHSACSRGDIKAIELLIKSGVDINQETNTRCNSLHIACQNGHLHVVILLLKRDANINSKTYQKLTPLHYAALFGYTDIIEYLLKKGADISIKSIDGITALEFAYENEKPAILKLFAQYGAKVVSEEEAERCGKEFFAKLNQTQQKKEPRATAKSPKKKKRKNQQQLSTKEPAPTVVEQTDATKPLAASHAVSTQAPVLPEQPAETAPVANPVTTEPHTVTAPVTDNNASTEISKKTAAKPLTQQPKNNGIKKPSNIPVHTASPVNTPDQYQIVPPKKWPRHLVHDSQINTMYEHFDQLRQWPQTDGLDIETLQGKLKGLLCMRVGGSRVIFTVNQTNRTIIIDEIALHHDGYKK